MSEFVENLKGVHVWSPCLSDVTLCGDAFDAPDTEVGWEDGPFLPTENTTVTCPDCVRMILGVRHIRVRPTP